MNNISQPTQCIAKPKLSSTLNHLIPAGVDRRHREFQAENWETAGELPWWENGDFTGKNAGFSWFFSISVIGKW